MSDSRTYGTQQDCPVARTLDLVGDRWTMLILRDLSWGRRRYSALLESLKGISTNLLSDRLKKLEEAEVVVAVPYSAHPPRSDYKLTAKGNAFLPVLVALRNYGEEWEPQAEPGAAQKQ